MKKTHLISLVATPLALVLCGVYWLNCAPSYVKDAEERVGSYLSYSYGPTTCMSDEKEVNAWAMKCQIASGKKDLNYTVYPAEKASEGSSRTFYIVAEDAAAKQSAKAELMVYLNINTHTS